MPKLHWTQTPEGRARMSEIQKKAHATIRATKESKARAKVTKALARFNKPTQVQNPTIVVQGWKITVVGSELRIERES